MQNPKINHNLLEKLTVSIIIPVHNGGQNFRACLDSIHQLLLKPIEVIVVADGDTDGSWEIAQQSGAQVIRLPSARGPARARNSGAKVAKGDILLFIDADVTLKRDTVKQVISLFINEPDVAAIIGSYDDSPSAQNFLSQYKNLFHHYTHQKAQEEASTFWGACGAIHRDVFLKIGGFNEDYYQPSVEDIELGYRLKQAGYQLRLCKTLQVKHLKQWGPISLLKTDIYNRALPWTNLILRYRQFNNDLNLQLTSRLSVVLVYLLLFSLVMTAWWREAALGSGLISLFLVILNWPIYNFFQQKKGWKFMINAILWHWLYFFYSGFSFALGFAQYYISTSLAKGSDHLFQR